jgi:hypothetical protein
VAKAKKQSKRGAGEHQTLSAASLSTGPPRLGAPELTQRHGFVIRPSHHHTLDAAPLAVGEPRFEWKKESIEPPRANWRGKLPKGSQTKTLIRAFIALFGDPPVLPSELREADNVVKARINKWLSETKVKRPPDPKTIVEYIRRLRSE